MEWTRRLESESGVETYEEEEEEEEGNRIDSGKEALNFDGFTWR
jgi:hypothetical protein